MKTSQLLLVAALGLAIFNVSAATLHVSLESTNPTPPYTNWFTAATNIQDAVDAAQTSDEIVVTNGTYATGGRAAYGTMTNRVAVDKPLTVRSVNGPEFTVIQGLQKPGTTNGESAIRCVYLADGARLWGFTLTNGATRTYPADYSRERSGGGLWCESTNVVVMNCVIMGNSADGAGGGASDGTLSNCTLASNSAYDGGGGAVGSTLNNCTLTGNLASWGGGVAGGKLNNCTLIGNSASSQGGGASGGTLNNCTLAGNSAEVRGGGAAGGALNNCALTGNRAEEGGGTYECSLWNCTLTGNFAGQGGGASWSTLNNCIAYFNTAAAGANYFGKEGYPAILNYCCTTPLPAGGVGNITLDPQLASGSHLSASSPCRAAGSAAYAAGTDIDGEAWSTPPSIGCDEYHVGVMTGLLSVRIAAVYTNVAAGWEVGFTALIEGRTTASVWDFGDGIVASNRPYATHGWAALGDYVVVLRAYNDSYPGGVSATVTVHVVDQPVHYVAADSANPLPPYTSWATAATNIQDAVGTATLAGSLVLVSNGVYATGRRAMHGTGTNRVAVDKPLMVRSVNGPEVTMIEGDLYNWEEGESLNIRCVYLASGASLSGFTLTNGATTFQESGGGVWCESATAVVSNCVLTGNSAMQYGGGVCGGTVNNCLLINNWAWSGGGGAYESTLYDCTLTGNSAYWAAALLGDNVENGGGSPGGGAFKCTLQNCKLTGNSGSYGGGAYESTLFNCTLTGNSSSSGGGACGGTLHSCTLTGNSASSGGGASRGALNNCELTSNSANQGGGMFRCTLDNCTLTGNWAEYGGGASGGTLNNTIVYFNTAANGTNHWDCYLNYCCTTPMPTNGVGNITLDPELASASHLSAFSPCRGAGNAAYASGSDIDGETWSAPPSIGCDEYHAGAVTGPLNVDIAVSYTNVTVGYPVNLTAFIEGRTDLSLWDFDDGSAALDQPYATHSWTAAGDYLVTLWAFNGSNAEGVSAAVPVHVTDQLVCYVAAGSTNPLPPYTGWATAATKIQDAVDAAPVGGTVLVTNGIYATGGRSVNGCETNRLAVTKPLTLRTVNGPGLTVIDGGGSMRCVYLASGPTLSGFTLTNGRGGVWCESATAVVSNCVLTGNSAGGAYGGTLYNCVLSGNAASSGGGASKCILYNCILSGNSANGVFYNEMGNITEWGGYGGGAAYCALYNCTLTGNSCWVTNCGGYGCYTEFGRGAGVYECTLNNCIVYYNSGYYVWNNYYGSALNYCNTTPAPGSGVGNITNAPLFLDTNGWRNLRLQSNSPCINAGLNAYASGPTDLDGLPRIVNGTVDIGAYEFQGPGSEISYAWLQHYGLPTDGSADFTDPDADGHNTWQEWRCQTDPTNALSALRLLSALPAGTNVTVSWQSVVGVNYFLERSTNLWASSPFTQLSTNLPGQVGTTTYTDTNTVLLAPLFYRVGVAN